MQQPAHCHVGKGGIGDPWGREGESQGAARDGTKATHRPCCDPAGVSLSGVFCFEPRRRVLQSVTLAGRATPPPPPMYACVCFALRQRPFPGRRVKGRGSPYATPGSRAWRGEYWRGERGERRGEEPLMMRRRRVQVGFRWKYHLCEPKSLH